MLKLFAKLALLCMFTTSAQAATQDLFKPYLNPGVASALTLSPDGKHIAMLRTTGDDNALITINVDKQQIVGNVSFPGKYEITSYQWANNERLVLSVARQKKSQEQLASYGELYGVNYDGKKGAFIFSFRDTKTSGMSRVKKREPIRGWAQQIIDVLPDDKKHVLLSYQPWNSDGASSYKVVKLNIYSGIVRKTLYSPAIIRPYFVTDANHDVVYAVGTTGYKKRTLYRRVNADWIDLGVDASPIIVNDQGFIAYDQASDGRRALYQFNHDASERSLVYKHDLVDVRGVEVSGDHKAVYAALVEPGLPGYAILNKSHPEAKVFYQLVQQFGSQYVSIVSSSDNGERLLVRTSSEYDRGSYHLYDTNENSLKTMVSWLAETKPPVQTIVDPISFASFDGEQVSGYMSHPDKKQVMPLVVYVHGGPHGVRDYWRFDPTIQILGAHGFRVLQVNYRGSGGYGKRFRRIGFRKWGSDIQQDIISGVEWAIEQGHASADNICIIGGSFGAYSALQSSILRPDLFKCTVGTAGVYDLPLMHKEGDIPEKVFGDDYLNDAVGNDMAELTRFSPVHNVDKLQSNVLIVHGTKDRRTPIEQANSLISAFNEAGFKHQYVELEGEGHGIFNDKSREQHYRRLVQFLSDNLN